MKNLTLFSLKTSDIKVFLHQRDAFWQTTTHTPGILINDQTITQVQIKFDDIRTLASKNNDCSYSGQGFVTHKLHWILKKWKIIFFIIISACP